MEKLGHKLLADNIDQQFVDIVLAKLVLAVEKLSKTANFRFSLQHLIKEECKAVAELLYYVTSFMSSGYGTPGMLAMGLTATNNNAIENSFLVVCFIALKWSLSKLQSLSTTEGWSTEAEGSMERRVYDAVQVGAIAVQALSALNYVIFLCRGDSPSLLYRLTGIAMRPVEGAVSRNTGSAAGYSTAQLYVEGKKALWLALMGATAAASITIDWRAMKHYAFYYASKVFVVLHRLRSSGSSTRSGDPGNQQQQDDFPDPRSSSQQNSSRECASCQLSPPEMPHAFECGHVYCYLCAHRLQCTGSISDTTDLTATVQCLQCYRSISRCVPVSNAAESTATGSSMSRIR